MKDNFGRVINYMRLSITDRCNLRCRYCMPEDLENIPHDQIMRYEEFLRLSEIFAGLGISKIKITGGEPLVRKGCVDFIHSLKQISGINNVTITTNGVLLAQNIDGLLEAGIDGINVSMDTMSAERYREITGRDEFRQVWKGICLALNKGVKLKINCVPMAGCNEDEIPAFFELARHNKLDVRFIEMMPIGYGKNFLPVSTEDIEKLLRKRYDVISTVTEKKGNGPAVYYRGTDFTGSIGLIGAVHHKFCDSCNRIRLTSEGFLQLCLASGAGTDLRGPLRAGASDSELEQLIRETIVRKPREHHFSDSGAEEIKHMSRIGG